MKRMLEKAGVRCSLVDNGKAAVEAVLADPSSFDCILMVGLLVVLFEYSLLHLCCRNPSSSCSGHTRKQLSFKFGFSNVI
jgi:hypothetical protein